MAGYGQDYGDGVGGRYARRDNAGERYCTCRFCEAQAAEASAVKLLPLTLPPEGGDDEEDIYRLRGRAVGKLEGGGAAGDGAGGDFAEVGIDVNGLRLAGLNRRDGRDEGEAGADLSGQETIGLASGVADQHILLAGRDAGDAGEDQTSGIDLGTEGAAGGQDGENHGQQLRRIDGGRGDLNFSVIGAGAEAAGVDGDGDERGIEIGVGDSSAGG